MSHFINDRVYKEVWEVLQIKKEIRDKIPNDVLQHIKKSALQSSYEISFSENEEDVFKNMSREALCLYISLYLQYIANEEEKEQLKKILIENEIEFKKNKGEI